MPDDEREEEWQQYEARLQALFRQQKEEVEALLSAAMQGMFQQLVGGMTAGAGREQEANAWTSFVAAGIHRGLTTKASMKLADKLLTERRERFLVDETVAAAMHVKMHVKKAP